MASKKRMYLDCVVTFRVSVEHLEIFQASTLEEAAINQKEWFDEGVHSVWDLEELAEIENIEVRAVRE